ncbi:MAG: C13 family peptidase, partial [Dehalococcoidia bacterium]
GIAPVEGGQLPGRLYAQSAGAGYLSPYGTRITHLNYEISSVELADWLKDLKSNNVVIMLDTCYSGSFSRELSQRGRIILMSSTDDEPSLECPEIGHGVFTNFILQAMDDFDKADINHDFILSAEEIFGFAEPLTTDGITTCNEEPLANTMKQHPVVSDGYPGELGLFMKVNIHCSVPSDSDTIMFDVDGNRYTSLLKSTFTWIPGSAHTIDFPATVENEDGERLVFVSWNDGTKSASRTITQGGDYTVTYKKQYKLTINSMYGNPKGGGWYDDGATAAISVISPDGKLIRQKFNGWYGSIVTTTKEANVIVDTAKYINAVWKADYF